VKAGTHEAITRVWRDESARLVGALVRLVGDLGSAEELAQDALVAALEEWPTSGVPDRPGAWLMATAKNRALNVLQRTRMLDRKHQALERESVTQVTPQLESAMDDQVRDDALRLLFIACHPVLSREARVALTLRLAGGLSTEEIARAFLVPEATMAQRLVRAKRALSSAGAPFELPRGDALAERLAAVLEVVYLVFNEGHSASSGSVLMRLDLAAEALRLGRLLAELAPAEPEALGLLALMELTAARVPARSDAAGDPVLLMDQDRSLWDAGLLSAGLATLERAELLGGERGPYRLQAAIAGCHARALRPEGTDWIRIAALYADLARRAPSPVVELNRALAVSRADGPAAGLALLDALADEPALARYPLFPGARADLLFQLGEYARAGKEFERAASLAGNDRVRKRLMGRAEECVRRSEEEE